MPENIRLRSRDRLFIGDTRNMKTRAIGRRRDYYAAPREDARVLMTRLDPNPPSPR